MRNIRRVLHLETAQSKSFENSWTVPRKLNADLLLIDQGFAAAAVQCSCRYLLIACFDCQLDSYRFR